MWLMASRCVSCTTCVYTSMVMLIRECPRISLTTRVKDRWRFRGSTGRPVRVVKTWSDFRQVSPALPHSRPSRHLPHPVPAPLGFRLR